ncbi:MAG: hypothetical protein JSS82_10170 [Bacteroidetes bacterium]|nr:hypothetical protein [Bacteroidota bacterium]
MKKTGIIIALVMLLTSCGARNEHRAEDQPASMINNSTDTFKTDSESATNGPDNAPPHAVDSSQARQASQR